MGSVARLDRKGQSQTNAAQRPKNVKYLKQPDHHVDHDDGIQELLDAAGHWDVAVDKAKQDADDQQPDDNGKQQRVNMHVRKSSGISAPDG